MVNTWFIESVSHLINLGFTGIIKWVKSFTFMHLADAFMQSDSQKFEVQTALMLWSLWAYRSPSAGPARGVRCLES